MNYPQQSYQVADIAGNTAAPASQQTDIIAMLWRWKWLPILGAILGSIGGLLIWVQTPPRFMAVGRIQVVNPMSQGLPTVNLDDGEGLARGRSDDVVIMTSHVVIKNAIEIGRLNSNPKLSDMNPDELVEWLRNKDRLTIRPGTKETITNIVEIMFRCDDGELAAEVVNAIILGYEKFINREASAMSTDVLQKLAKFRDDYDIRSAKVRQEYLRIRNDYGLIGSGNELKDPYTEALLRDNEELSQIESKLVKINATLDVINKAPADLPVESLLSMIGRLNNDLTVMGGRSNDALSVEMNKETYLNRDDAATRMRIDLLVPLESQLKSLQKSYGNNHSLVAPLIERVNSVRESIAELEAKAEADLLKKNKTLEEINTTPVTGQERLRNYVISLENEATVLMAQQQSVEASARENEKKSKEMNYAIANLEVVRSSMDSITESAEELKNALEKLTLGTNTSGKVMKRLEIPQVGGQDGPSLPKYVGLAGFLGAIAFTGLAYLLELADRSYRGPDEIARDLGVPILGHLQMTSLTRRDRKDESMDLSLVAFHKAKSTASEAYRGVRTAIYFGNQAGNIKVIQVTSPVPGDGKSTVASNLAISISQSGRRTLLLDCDMRRPRLAKLMGARDDIGLTNILAGKVSLDEAVQSTIIPNLDVLTCGRRPGNPAELLLSDDFVDVVNSLRERYDYIIMDTPPILAVSDPANASACADGVILTLRLRRNLRPLAIRAAQMLQAVNANLLGVAINGVTGRAGYGYGGYRYDGARSAMGYGGYGGYGYGATYGYGDYYTSSTAESVAGRVVKAGDKAVASANGHHGANGSTGKGTAHKPDDTTKS